MTKENNNNRKSKKHRATTIIRHQENQIHFSKITLSYVTPDTPEKQVAQVNMASMK